MSEEITAGLRNAIERGESLEKAMQGFINAGYDPVDVKRSAEALRRGATSIINQEMPSRPVNQSFNQEMSRPAMNQEISNRPAERLERMEETPPAQRPAYAPLKQDMTQTGGVSYANYPNQGAGYENYSNNTSKKNIGLVITLIILFLLLVGALIFMVVYGKEWLGSIFG